MEQTASIGVDVAKAKLDICFATGIDKVLKEVTILNDTEHIIDFIKKLKNLSKDIPIVVESTGDYHILFCLLLAKQGFHVCLINPLITKQYARTTVRKQKSDTKDAEVLSRIGILQPKDLKVFALSKDDVILKKKISLIGSLHKKRQAMQGSIKSLLDIHTVLEEEPTLAIHNLEDVLDELKRAIGALEKELVNTVKQNPPDGFLNISAINGVSEESAAKVLTYIKGKDFSDVRQLVAFAGLDITTKLSGTSVHGHGKVSKRGDPYFRKTLFHIAWGLKMHNTVFKEMYEKYKAKGKHYREILLILARKFLHVIYGMLKNNTSFNEKFILIS